MWNAHKTKNHKKSYKILRTAMKKAVRTVVVKPYPGEQKAVNEGVVELNPGSRPVLTKGRAKHQGQHQNCPGKQGDARPESYGDSRPNKSFHGRERKAKSVDGPRRQRGLLKHRHQRLSEVS